MGELFSIFLGLVIVGFFVWMFIEMLPFFLLGAIVVSAMWLFSSDDPEALLEGVRQDLVEFEEKLQQKANDVPEELVEPTLPTQP